MAKTTRVLTSDTSNPPAQVIPIKHDVDQVSTGTHFQPCMLKGPDPSLPAPRGLVGVHLPS